MTQAVFSALIEIMPLFRYEYEIKRVLLGISAILRCNFSQIPSVRSMLLFSNLFYKHHSFPFGTF